MPGNTFGQALRITTFGESHGPAVGAVVEGCPPCLALSEADFLEAMARRRPGTRPFDSPRSEKDRVILLSGVFEDRTTGTPITLLIHNQDADSRPYEQFRHLFRPGHADISYHLKYGHRDHRGGGRASARETAARVAAGVIAEKILQPAGVSVQGYTVELAGVRAGKGDIQNAAGNPFRCADSEAAARMAEALEVIRASGDSAGGIIEVLITGCPPGLGEPVFDKLDADLAKAVMSVGAVKGVEIGAGFESARLRGSENNDPITPEGFASNHAGGILGGVSTGADIILRAAVKPIPSIGIEQQTIDRNGKPSRLKLSGRHDTTAVSRIVPVLEAMALLVLADHYLRARAQMTGPFQNNLQPGFFEKG